MWPILGGRCGGAADDATVGSIRRRRRRRRKLLLGLAFPIRLGARVKGAGGRVVEPLTVGTAVVVAPRQDTACEERAQGMLVTAFGALGARDRGVLTSRVYEQPVDIARSLRSNVAGCNPALHLSLIHI